MRQDPRITKTEAAIRSAFIRLVEEQGYTHVSVKDICERAEINRNTFYLHYADKDALVMSMLHAMIASQAAPVAAVVSHLSTATPQEVEEIVRNILAVLMQELNFYRILFSDPALQGYMQAMYRTAHSMISSGASRPVSPVALSYMIFGFIGVVTEWLMKKSTDTEEIVPTLARLLIAGMPELYRV